MMHGSTKLKFKDARFTREIKFQYCNGKSNIHREVSFGQQIGHIFKVETSKVLQLGHSFMVL